MLPVLLLDSYKLSHRKMYPQGTQKVYSNWTPRKSRLDNTNYAVFFGLQYFIKKYLIYEFNNNFFYRDFRDIKIEYQETISVHLGKEHCDVEHLRALHDLGYLPLKIKALPEGTRVPIGVPCMTIENTHPDFFWITNYMETILSTSLWQACTSATIADRFYNLLRDFAVITDPDNEAFVRYQGHDFSMRGMSSLESACLSGAGHATRFYGSDTVPAIPFLFKYYDAYDCNPLLQSVPASEHSVMCMYGDSNEFECFKRLITEVYPTGIVSVVSDTWNLWKVVTEFLPKLKNEILNRDGKVVIRPDSSRTTPQDILCGTPFMSRTWSYDNNEWNKAEELGLVRCLWELFGGTESRYGYRKLDEHIGIIYGDAITYDRCKEICERLYTDGFASTNVVYGVGSYSYQYNTRDTLGFAMKATYGIVNKESRNLFKDPITDDGEKKSHTGLLIVYNDDGDLKVGSSETVEKDLLESVFVDGDLIMEHSFDSIRERLN